MKKMVDDTDASMKKIAADSKVGVKTTVTKQLTPGQKVTVVHGVDKAFSRITSIVGDYHR